MGSVGTVGPMETMGVVGILGAIADSRDYVGYRDRGVYGDLGGLQGP